MIIYVLYTSYEADAAKKAAVTIRIPRCPCYPVVVVIKHDWLESYRVTSTSRDWGFQAAPVFFHGWWFHGPKCCSTRNRDATIQPTKFGFKQPKMRFDHQEWYRTRKKWVVDPCPVTKLRMEIPQFWARWCTLWEKHGKTLSLSIHISIRFLMFNSCGDLKSPKTMRIQGEKKASTTDARLKQITKAPVQGPFRPVAVIHLRLIGQNG